MIKYSASEYEDEISKTINAWDKGNNIQRLWNGDASLWTGHDENEWLGWMDLDNPALCETSRIETLADDIKKEGIEYIVLLGMGGSSLCPDMMARTFGKIAGNPELHILDSTDPLQIQHTQAKIAFEKALFIVSSKSGSTLEPNILKDYFYQQLQSKLNKQDVGDKFIIITDPGSSLEINANNQHVKAIFHGLPSIGGRYSALSHFGMVPSGLMGIDIKTYLNNAKEMAKACLPNIAVKDNPAAILGIILAVCAKDGKDKVTLITSPGIKSIGAWIEQLLAESTGKQGKGLIPIDQEPVGIPSVYGDDRVFVYIRLEGDIKDEQDRAVDALEHTGFVVIRCFVKDKMHLGAELFRWEMATAIAGSILGINPFDQPDVEASKIRTKALMDSDVKTGALSQVKPFFSDNNIELYADERDAQDLSEHMSATPSIQGYLRAHFNRISEGNYVDFSAFIEMSDAHIDLLQQIRTFVRDSTKAATCVGFGPRFLHSTGQLYKGGPNTGVFLQITTDHQKDDIAVPNKPYTFGLVIAAEAQGDFEVLGQRFRRALRVHVKDENIALLTDLILEALQNSKGDKA